MGGEWSSHEREPSPDHWWGVSQPGTSTNVSCRLQESTDSTEKKPGRKVSQEMDAFKKEIARKRELRHAAIAAVQNEMKKIKSDLASERSLRLAAEENVEQLMKAKCDKVLLEEIEMLKKQLEEEIKIRKEVQEVNDQLKEKESELEAVENQVKALKEVASIGREMLKIRELQVNELKKKLQEIESSLPTAPEDLRIEYEVQIENIRKLRRLYEERALAARTEHQQERQRDSAKIHVLEIKVKEQQNKLQDHKDQNTDLQQKISKIENTVDEKSNEIESLKDQLYSSTAECRSLKSQMKIINDLFSHVLAGPDFDLDRLTRLLKENHGLITDLTAKGDNNEVAALLLDIADKAESEEQLGTMQDTEDENVRKEKEEIASNLSKVWRVLVELLSHYKDVSQNNAGGSESCYKSIDTPSGPRLVISVSQTFLTLKDLILEKNSLVKEVGRLKTLNGHLENRMHSQERRLSIVTTELKKTWSVVSKLRTQHKQLHNHEKILRYELQHKRQMLVTLRQELEHCREKWDRARQKNTQSEEDWKQLRKEFAMRKTRKLSNSAESGYEEGDPHSLNATTKHDSTESSETEEDIEHSDGNSYETVIDVLDIAQLESQIENDNLTTDDDLASFMGNAEIFELSPGLSSIPSSTSSPVPTETEDLSEISEDIPRSISPFYQLHYTQEPIIVPEIPHENLLFGSNSAENISRFLDGLIVYNEPNTSQTVINNEHVNQSPEICKTKEKHSSTPLIDKYTYLNVASSHVNSEKTSKDNVACESKPISVQSEGLSERDTMDEMKIEDESIFNTDSVAKAIQLCLQDIKNNITPFTQFTEEKKTFEINETEISNSSNYSEIDVTSPKPKDSCEISMPKEVLTRFSVSKNNCEKNPEESQSNLLSVASHSNGKTKTPEEIIRLNMSMKNSENDSHETQVNVSVASQGNSETKTPEEIIKLNVTMNDSENNTHESQNNVLFVASHSNSETKTPEEIIRLNVSMNNSENNTHESQSNVLFVASHSNSVTKTLDEITKLKVSINNSENKTQELQSNIPFAASHTNSENNIQETQSNIPSAASHSKHETRTPQQIMEARAARLKRMEEQCKSLFTQMSATSKRSDLISNKLEELHEQYGPILSSEEPNSVSVTGDKISDVDRLNEPSTSTSEVTRPSTKDNKSPEVINSRAARLKQLEENCKLLHSQISKTNEKSKSICKSLEELHEHYGSSEIPNDKQDIQNSKTKDDTK